MIDRVPQHVRQLEPEPVPLRTLSADAITFDLDVDRRFAEPRGERPNLLRRAPQTKLHGLERVASHHSLELGVRQPSLDQPQELVAIELILPVARTRCEGTTKARELLFDPLERCFERARVNAFERLTLR